MVTTFYEGTGEVRERDFAYDCGRLLVRGYTPHDSEVFSSNQPMAMAIREMMERARRLHPEDYQIDLWE